MWKKLIVEKSTELKLQVLVACRQGSTGNFASDAALAVIEFHCKIYGKDCERERMSIEYYTS